MVAVVSLLVVVLVSLVITRFASAIFRFTGMSRDSARFQARSAFSGTGFTTDEAESVVNHPLRRRITLALMLLGNAGLVSVISTLVWSFVGTETGSEALIRALVLVVGLTFFAAVAGSERIDTSFRQLVEWGLRRFTNLEESFVKLVEVEEDFTIGRIEVDPEDWLANRRIDDVEIDEEGVLILGLTRPDGSFVGNPRGRYTIRPGDTLLLYGPHERLDDLRQRLSGKAGDREHREAQVEYRKAMERQDRHQREYAARRDGES